MWVMVLFDLPTDSKKARREYTRFRSRLKKDGFTMLQYSVYGRACPSEENAVVHENRVQKNLPPAGQVRVLTLTDKQFTRMRIYYGKKREKNEKAAEQLSFF
ncbi:MAG: CRISPR-associated endonuclease Cas2 [Myxococcales bacterium]|nr:CRISPR-associated endonuclease Cas2 [Myxococcales bacterium]